MAKLCPVCRTAYEGAAWDALAFVGLVLYEVEDGRNIRLELRNCPCRNTLARRLDFAGDEEKKT